MSDPLDDPPPPSNSAFARILQALRRIYDRKVDSCWSPSFMHQYTFISPHKEREHSFSMLFDSPSRITQCDFVHGEAFIYSDPRAGSFSYMVSSKVLTTEPTPKIKRPEHPLVMIVAHSFFKTGRQLRAQGEAFATVSGAFENSTVL